MVVAIDNLSCIFQYCDYITDVCTCFRLVSKAWQFCADMLHFPVKIHFHRPPFKTSQIPSGNILNFIKHRLTLNQQVFRHVQYLDVSFSKCKNMSCLIEIISHFPNTTIFVGRTNYNFELIHLFKFFASHTKIRVVDFFKPSMC